MPAARLFVFGVERTTDSNKAQGPFDEYSVGSKTASKTRVDTSPPRSDIDDYDPLGYSKHGNSKRMSNNEDIRAPTSKSSDGTSPLSTRTKEFFFLSSGLAVVLFLRFEPRPFLAQRALWCWRIHGHPRFSTLASTHAGPSDTSQPRGEGGTTAASGGPGLQSCSGPGLPGSAFLIGFLVHRYPRPPTIRCLLEEKPSRFEETDEPRHLSSCRKTVQPNPNQPPKPSACSLLTFLDPRS